MDRAVFKKIGRASVFALAMALAPACVAQTAQAPTAQARTGVVVAGGALDPSFTGAEVYAERPVAATPPPGRACAAAATYVELVNSGQFNRIADLFEEDGLLMEPRRDGPATTGREHIRQFYEGYIGRMRPTIVPVAYLGNDTDCMVELSPLSTVRGEQRFALVSIDHFTLGATGKVARMVAFARPPRTE